MPKLKNKPTLWEQQGIVHIGLILILLAGLVAGVYLVQHPQIFKPKASGDILWLVDENGERLPLKEGTDVFEVSSPQIHIKINQPIWQASLPGLVGNALAQSTACNGTVYSCSDIKCDDGSTAPGTGCYETGGDPNNRYRTECKRNCPASSTTGGTGSSGTTTNTGTTADVSTPTITGASWDREGSYLTISGSGFGNSQGTVYYSRGGNEQIPSQSVNSWSAGSVKIGAEIPLGATKTIENMISEGNYLKVCRADGRCSAYWSPIPERRQFKVDIPTAPKDAPQGGGAPAAPTQPQIPEATDKMRISMDQSKLDSDEACTEDTDPQKHCMKFTPGDLAARALIGKDYVDWWLANKPGETQTIYVRLVSNKGKDYKLNGLDPSIKVIYQPAQAAAKPVSPSPGTGRVLVDNTIPGITSASWDQQGDYLTITGTNFGNQPGTVYYSRGGDEQIQSRSVSFWSAGSVKIGAEIDLGSAKSVDNMISGGNYLKVCRTDGRCSAYWSPIPERPKVSAPTPQGTPAPAPAKPSCREVGICVKDIGDPRSFYSESGFLCLGSDKSKTYSCPPAYPICLTDANCKTAVVPSPSPTPPAPSPPPAALPITGKVKITANGRQYNAMEVLYIDDNDQVKTAQLKLEVSLPTNVNQEGSYTTGAMRRSKTAVTAAVSMTVSGGGDKYNQIYNPTELDCPGRPIPYAEEKKRGCWVAKGSTQDLSLTLPAPQFQEATGKGNPDNPVAGRIYVKNNTDKQVTVQKVEQLTSEPVFSFWFVQIGADYTQLNSQPISIEPKQYVSFEAIVVACSRSDMESLKEKEVKVDFTVDSEVVNPQIGSVVLTARGKYQCGRSGIVTIP